MDSRQTRTLKAIVLDTKRLTLRHLTTSDAEVLCHIHHEAGVWKYFRGSPPASVGDERAKIEWHLAYYREHGFGLWAAVLCESSELIGQCGLLTQVVDGRSETGMVYLLSPRFWGRGLAAEAARGIRDHAFASLGCARLVSLVHPDNIASKHVATAAGLHNTRRARYKKTQVEVFSLEKNQW